MRLMCEQNVQWMMVMPSQNPALASDPRLEKVYTTDEPYLRAAGEGNMSVYRLHFDEGCQE
jgi:hypothetical protein